MRVVYGIGLDFEYIRNCFVLLGEFDADFYFF